MARSEKENGLVVTKYSSYDGEDVLKIKELESHICFGCKDFMGSREFCINDPGDKFPDCFQRSLSVDVVSQ